VRIPSDYYSTYLPHIVVHPETPIRRSGAAPVVVTSPHFGTFAPPSSPHSPAVNHSPSQSHPATTFHTQIRAASPLAYLSAPSIKTPQEIVADLDSILEIGTFYIVTRGREPGIYTDW
jgi:Caulimovirus viroplasmin